MTKAKTTGSDDLSQIRLGVNAKDLTTGVSGILTYSVLYMNGNLRFGLQPMAKAKDADKIPEAYELDVQCLEYIDEGVVSRVIPCPIETGIVLGVEVEDIVTKQKGIATQRHDSMNGCVYYAVQSKLSKEHLLGKPPHNMIDYAQLKVTGKGVKEALTDNIKKAWKATEKLLKKDPSATSNPVPAYRTDAGPGAPMTRARRL